MRRQQKENYNLLASEEINLPGPHPARAIYGFALFIVSWCSLILYLGWALIPTPLLNYFGITYVPSKLWAIGIGILIPILAALYVTVIFCINVYNFGGYSIFRDVQTVEEDFGKQSTSSDEFRKVLEDIRKRE